MSAVETIRGAKMVDLIEQSEGTRARILEAALELFGERGPTGTTVRDIAGRAKVNVAAISYHFRGKEELYRAVAEMVTTHIEGRVRERMAATLANPPADPDAALAALETLLETVVDVIVGPPEMRRVARFIIREQMQPTAAFETLFGMFSGLHVAACRLFGAAAGLDPEAPEARLRVFMVIGQAIFLRIAEAAVLRRMRLDQYDAEFLETVKRLLKQNLRAIVAAAREGGTL
jgi:AcrR family transcriptional regulator